MITNQSSPELRARLVHQAVPWDQQGLEILRRQ